MTQPERIAELHRELNRPDVVPRHCYRRNKVHYEIVCYINNIICLLLSENYEVIPVFIGRAATHMNEFPSNDESSRYYTLANSYLKLVAKLVLARGFSLSEFAPAEFVQSIRDDSNAL